MTRGINMWETVTIAKVDISVEVKRWRAKNPGVPLARSVMLELAIYDKRKFTLIELDRLRRELLANQEMYKDVSHEVDKPSGSSIEKVESYLDWLESIAVDTIVDLDSNHF